MPRFRGSGIEDVLEDSFWSPWPWSWPRRSSSWLWSRPRTLQVLENWPVLGRGQQLFASF